MNMLKFIGLQPEPLLGVRFSFSANKNFYRSTGFQLDVKIVIQDKNIRMTCQN